MLDRGVLFHPGAFENLFISFAHTEEDVDRTLEAARETARVIRNR
jgi:glutamate-1-semialdehyde 2,1-aminomutase